jgi:hypothetical protein
MVKIVDYKIFGWGVVVSIVVGLVSAGILHELEFTLKINLAISVVVALIGLLFSYLHLIVKGMEQFEYSIDKYSTWVSSIVDSLRFNGFDLEELLTLITSIRDKMKKSPGTTYNSIAKEVFDNISFQITHLANDEYRTTGQGAYDTYIKFIDSLKYNETYLATSAVGIKSFWQNEQMKHLLREANERAVQERKVKIKRIFILPSLEDLRNDKAALEEIKEHEKIGVDVKVVSADSLPNEEYKRDFGIFNNKHVGYLELGPNRNFIGVKYHFAKREVQYAIRIYKKLEKFDVVKLHRRKNLEELLAGEVKEGKNGAATG